MRITSNINNDFAFTSANDIKSICKPLFDSFGITYFDYFRSYDDGSRVWLCSSGEWVDYIYQQKYWHTKNFDFKLASNLKAFLWTDLTNYMPAIDAQKLNMKISDAYNHFNIKKGIAVADRQANYIDFYNFATSTENRQIYNLCQNVDILKRFILYFRERANPILKQAFKNLILPLAVSANIDEENKVIGPDIFSKNKRAFIEQTDINRLYLEDNETYFTKREIACLKLLSVGKSAKEIGRYLKVSNRTVEFYLKNIKSKLHYHRQSELIAFLKAHDFFDVV